MEAICYLTEIPDGQARSFAYKERTMLVVRQGLQAYAYVNRCPHAGVELNWEEDKFMSRCGTFLQCSTHGALFEPDTGRCLAGPCAGASLASIPLRVEDGQLFVD